MRNTLAEQMASKRCVPCDGGTARFTPGEAEVQMKAIPQWRLADDGRRIRRDWTVKNFMAGVDFLNRVAALAEQEGHHPDLHLENYRHVWIELWTHAVDGLSENDFILAAKIDSLPIETRK